MHSSALYDSILSLLDRVVNKLQLLYDKYRYIYDLPLDLPIDISYSIETNDTYIYFTLINNISIEIQIYLYLIEE